MPNRKANLNPVIEQSDATVNSKYDTTEADDKTTVEINEVVESSGLTETGALGFKVSSFPTSQEEFNELSWDDVKGLAPIAKADPEKYTYAVGWTKIANGVTWRIVDVGHKFPNNGTTYGFVFQSTSATSNSAMYSSNAIGQTYNGSLIANALKTGSWSELTNIASTVTISYNSSCPTTGGVWTATANSTLSTNFFIPCIYEVFGSSSSATGSAYSSEGTQFRYYSQGGSKQLATYWWLRSLFNWLSSGSITNFARVDSDGPLAGNPSNTTYGVCPCFAI